MDIDPDLPRGRGAPTERRGAEGRARPRGIADPEPRRVLGEPQSRGTPAVECLGDPGGGGSRGAFGTEPLGIASALWASLGWSRGTMQTLVVPLET